MPHREPDNLSSGFPTRSDTSGYTATEDGLKLEISDLGGYRAADLRIRFSICKKQVSQDATQLFIP